MNRQCIIVTQKRNRYYCAIASTLYRDNYTLIRVSMVIQSDRGPVGDKTTVLPDIAWRCLVLVSRGANSLLL